MPVAELLDTMSAEEFVLWKADYMMRPWSDDRAELYSALVAQAVSAPWCKSSTKLKDFLIDWDHDPQREWRQQQARAIMQSAEARYRQRQKQKENCGK